MKLEQSNITKIDIGVHMFEANSFYSRLLDHCCLGAKEESSAVLFSLNIIFNILSFNYQLLKPNHQSFDLSTLSIIING